MKRLLLLVALSAFVQAQPAWLSRVSVRESLDDKKVPQPAFLTLVFPSGAPRSYTAGIGLRMDLAPDSVSDKLQLGPFLEYAKNTETKKEQDSLKGGLSADWTPRDLSIYTWSPIITAKANYARDHIKKTTSAQANAYFTIQPRAHGFDPHFWYVPNIKTRLGPIIVLYSPSVGLEDDDTLRATTAADERNVPRAYSRFALDLTPSNGSVKDRVEYTLDLAYRRDLTSTADRGHRLLQHNLNVYLFREVDTDRSAGIGAAYVTGEDPTKGFQNQKVVRLSIILRL